MTEDFLDEVMSDFSHKEQIKVTREHVRQHPDSLNSLLFLKLWEDQSKASEMSFCALSRVFGFRSLDSEALAGLRVPVDIPLGPCAHAETSRGLGGSQENLGADICGITPVSVQEILRDRFQFGM